MNKGNTSYFRQKNIKNIFEIGNLSYYTKLSTDNKNDNSNEINDKSLTHIKNNYFNHHPKNKTSGCCYIKKKIKNDSKSKSNIKNTLFTINDSPICKKIQSVKLTDLKFLNNNNNEMIKKSLNKNFIKNINISFNNKKKTKEKINKVKTFNTIKKNNRSNDSVDINNTYIDILNNLQIFKSDNKNTIKINNSKNSSKAKYSKKNKIKYKNNFLNLKIRKEINLNIITDYINFNILRLNNIIGQQENEINLLREYNKNLMDKLKKMHEENLGYLYYIKMIESENKKNK